MLRDRLITSVYYRQIGIAFSVRYLLVLPSEGDVCIFELLKSRDVVLKVTLFRVLEDGGLMNHP